MVALSVPAGTGDVVVPPRPLRIHRRAAELLGEDLLHERQLAPFNLTEDELFVASACSDLPGIARSLEQEFGYRVRIGWEMPDLIAQALSAYFTPDQLPVLIDEQAEAWLDALGSTSAAATGANGRARAELEGERECLEGLSLATDFPLVRLERWPVNPAIARLFSETFARQRRVLPLMYLAGVLYVAIGNPADRELLAEIENLVGCPVQVAVAADWSLDRALDQAYTREAFDPARETPRVVRSGRVERVLAWRPSLELLQSDDERACGAPSPEAQVRDRARRFHLRAIRLDGFTSGPDVAALIPRRLAERLGCLPLSVEPDYVRLAVSGDEPLIISEAVSEILGRPVEPLIVDAESLTEAIRRSYEGVETVTLPPPPPAEAFLRLTRAITAASFTEAGALAARTGETLPAAVLELGLIDVDDLAEIEGLRNGVPWLRLAQALPGLEAIASLAADAARDTGALPLRRENGVLHVAVEHLESITAIERLTGYTVRPVVAHRSEVLAAIERLYSRERRAVPALEALLNTLMTRGRINRRQRADAYAASAITGAPADVALVRAGVGNEFEVAELLAEFADLPLQDLGLYERGDSLALVEPRRALADPVEEEAARLVPLATAQRFGAMPVRLQGDRVLLAVADPFDQEGIEAVAAALQRNVSVVVSPRSSLDAAIRRTLGRRNIGDYLVEAGLVTPEELTRAYELSRQTGVRIGKALLTLGFVTEEQLSSYLAEQWEVPFFEVHPQEISADTVRLLPEEMERRRGIIPLAADSDSVMVGMLDPLDRSAREEAARLLQRPIVPVLTTERQFDAALEAVYRADYLERSANDLLFRSPEDSAFHVVTRPQQIVMIVFGLLVVAGLALNYIVTLSVLISLAVVFYFAFSGYKLYLIYKALAGTLEVFVTSEEIAALEDRDLPIYTVIVPMYREGNVLPILVDALDRLDYPKTKLEVLLMLEEDDVETIEMTRRMRLPEGFRVLVVPHGQPKGKPKACNYGLLHARGELVVLFDAEDVPEPDQLKKALIAFREGGPQLVTVQAKLNYFNRDQNLLTRWFTAEYSMWFDLLLPGLDNSGAPIPLGGTSNHFRTDVLRELGGWDPYNVTEDADLGIRLFKHGYRTVVINSTTYEEANSNLYNWIRQRSRWIKGYMQTWLVHMRHPVQLLRSIGLYPFLSLQLIIAGTFFVFLVNPIFWGITLLWFPTHWGVIERIFPGPVFYLGAIALYFGNFAFVYINVAGTLRREYHQLVKFTLLTPIYWMFMSVAAWKALYQLIFRPSYWEKTTHGLYRGKVRVPGQSVTRKAA